MNNNNDNDIQFELCTICKSDDMLSVATLHDKMEELRESNNVALTVLRDKIKRLNPCNVSAVRELNKHPFFHKACLNKNVTLDVIEYLLAEFPGIERVMSLIGYHDCDHPPFSAGYPLHLCCYNMSCPSSVIELMLKKYPDALSHYATVQFFDKSGSRFDFGFRAECYHVCPLQYYLGRFNIDIDTVRLLLDGYPQAMLANDDQGREDTFTALHAFLYNRNINNLQHILTFLIEVEPSSVRTFDAFDRTPLLNACDNQGVTVAVVEILFNQWPEAIRIMSQNSQLPIHELCRNEKLDDVNSLDVLRYMIGIDSDLVRERNESDYLPIHCAFQGKKSVAFLRELIEAYPESIRVRTVSWVGMPNLGGGSLPIHVACQYGKVDQLQYLLELDPDSIYARDGAGRLHIHLASAEGNADIVEFLLKYDPSKESVSRCDSSGNLPLHLACGACFYRNRSGTELVQILFDAYPEAIHITNGLGKSPFDLAWEKAVLGSRYMSPEESPLVNFLLTQQAYARQAHAILHKETVDIDENDCTLRCAFKDNASLGSVKLLVRALSGHVSLHLHLACEFSSAKVVQYLIELDGIPQGHLDMNKDSILHSACRGGNLGVIKYFLDNHVSFVASAEVNDENKLPIHLLCEAGKDKVDRESPEFIVTIWRMLLANPEAVVSTNQS